MRTPLHSSLLALLLIMSGALSGCATLSEGQCRTADWYQIGRQDGNNGLERARLHQHHKACAEYGIRPLADRYYAGRDAGLQRYCTPRRGFEHGLEGRPYRGVCPLKLEPAFLAAYREGKEIHDVESAIDDIEHDIDRYRRRLEQDDLGRDERRTLRRQLHDLRQGRRYREQERVRLYRRSAYQ